jgi:hypothetical protein
MPVTQHGCDQPLSFFIVTGMSIERGSMGKGSRRGRVPRADSGNDQHWWHRMGTRTTRRIAGIGTVAAALVAITAFVINLGTLTSMVGSIVEQKTRPSPSPTALVPDREEPNGTVCADPKNVVTAVEAMALRPDGGHFGKLELRYSRLCHGGWGRVTVIQSDPLNQPPLSVEVNTRTLPDGRVYPFTYKYKGEDTVHSNLLLARGGCVFAEVRIIQNGRIGPYARTDCVNDKGYSRPAPTAP